jgi:predicted membrane protein
MENVEEEKEKLTEELSKQYSQNNISLEEYERLIEYVNKIETNKELTIIKKIAEEVNSLTINGNNIKIANKNYVKNHYTILSSQKIYGSMLNEIGGNIITILGDTRIIININDFTQNEIIVNIKTILGDTIIYVPENVMVINKAVPLLGDINIDTRISNSKNVEKTKLIITGKIILGDLTIKTKK